MVLARPFNSFGPRQSARAVIPTIITQALTRDRVELGALSPTRDFTFVEDTATALAACAEVDGIEGETFNVGSGEERSVGEIADEVLELLDRQLPVVTTAERQRPPASEVERLLADTTKARRELGWAPMVPFSTGLERTIDWIGRALEKYRPTVYSV